MDLVKKVKQYINTRHLLSKNDTVIVGVSGGPDSVALISILHALQYELKIKLIAAHFNHCLRPEAQGDERFVEDLCRDLNLDFIRGEWKKEKLPQKGSLEELARQVRFKFFVKTARAKKANVVALGHHRDDLAETILMRILRGTGLQGMQAILPKREINGFNFIRPLLGVTKEEIKDYLRKHNLKFRMDATNKNIDFSRNKIRLKLLPLLEKEYKTNIREVLANLSENAAADYEYLKTQALKSFKRLRETSGSNTIQFNLDSFKREHLALKRLLIRLSIEHLKGDTNQLTMRHWKEIENLLDDRPFGSIVHLPGDIYVQKRKYHLIIGLRIVIRSATEKIKKAP